LEERSGKPRLLVVTGLAGAGKTVAIRALEDLGYYCVDNLPSTLIAPFLESLRNGTLSFPEIALALDSRDALSPRELIRLLGELRLVREVEILFLDAQESVVLKRFRETRRAHPLSRAKVDEHPLGLGEAIRLDASMLSILRPLATRVIDTSQMSAEYLRKLIRHDYATRASDSEVLYNIISFGFKHGMPGDVDTVFDVRCFPNPYYDLKLRPLTGLHPEVFDFVFAEPNVKVFVEKVTSLLVMLHPLYKAEGKRYFGIGFGCTGGKHRSVAIAEEMSARLRPHLPLVSVEHRHSEKE
jgi:RNase adapter protein RapZ